MEKKQNNTKIDELEDFPEYKIKTFSIKDKSLKQLGELLANETSRSIIILLAEEELYVNQIAETLNMRVSLVIHHLQKLEGLGILDIVEKPITRKTKNHRFFRMRTNIFLEFLEDKKIKQVFKEGLKFASIGVAALISSTIPHDFFSRDTWSGLNNVNEYSSELPLMVITIGLVIERIHIYFKNKKKM